MKWLILDILHRLKINHDSPSIVLFCDVVYQSSFSEAELIWPCRLVVVQSLNCTLRLKETNTQNHECLYQWQLNKIPDNQSWQFTVVNTHQWGLDLVGFHICLHLVQRGTIFLLWSTVPVMAEDKLLLNHILNWYWLWLWVKVKRDTEMLKTRIASIFVYYYWDTSQLN